MSSSGLVNQELASARQMIGAAADQSAFRHCAAQLLFAYRCFLLEVADIHSLSLDREYFGAGSLLDELRKRHGSGTNIAELEAFNDSGWSLQLEEAQHAYIALQNGSSTARANSHKERQNIINAVQLADLKGRLSPEILEHSLDSLTGLVRQLRELSQEY